MRLFLMFLLKRTFAYADILFQMKPLSNLSEENSVFKCAFYLCYFSLCAISHGHEMIT